ncbi:MAG: DUF2103 domain-containing protein [Candidatus Absconditabacterales bacterium]|nr:DUF2103 domain-containing protein [Candidatus Absconditabacterales bacterium]
MAKKTSKFTKTRILHTILPEFHNFLRHFEIADCIARIIPARIARKQKGSSERRVTLQYNTPSGWKLLCKKGSTAQEMFVICHQGTEKEFVERCRVCGIAVDHIVLEEKNSTDLNKMNS